MTPDEPTNEEERLATDITNYTCNNDSTGCPDGSECTLKDGSEINSEN